MDKLKQKEFLERIPPNTEVFISDFEAQHKDGWTRVAVPAIELHCDKCQGLRFFAPTENGKTINDHKPFDAFLEYVCRNCRTEVKTFALTAAFDEQATQWRATKYGEVPTFGPPTPARAITLIGPDRDLFLKGRRCEIQGLGIGAFVYYRRVVENQKNRIFDEIIRVAEHVAPDPALKAELDAAKKETQFTKAVDSIKHALPQMLLINGQNPLVLLHSALSTGVHEEADKDCLEIAGSIRVVLVEFADRLAQAMKDEAELKNAVTKLTKKKK
jgi:hypothetical protein